MVGCTLVFLGLFVGIYGIVYGIRPSSPSTNPGTLPVEISSDGKLKIAAAIRPSDKSAVDFEIAQISSDGAWETEFLIAAGFSAYHDFEMSWDHDNRAWIGSGDTGDIQCWAKKDDVWVSKKLPDPTVPLPAEMCELLVASERVRFGCQ
jgi:hypothetical protein